MFYFVDFGSHFSRYCIDSKALRTERGGRNLEAKDQRGITCLGLAVVLDTGMRRRRGEEEMKNDHQ